MSTVDNSEFLYLNLRLKSWWHHTSPGRHTINDMRKRPPLTASGAKQTWKVFSDAYEKELPIPTFIFYYNHYIGGVDIAD